MLRVLSRVRGWCRAAWPWVTLVALALAAAVGVRRAAQALDRAAEAKRMRERAERSRAEEARALADSWRASLLAEAERHRAQALAAGTAVRQANREHLAARARIESMGPTELAQAAAEQARRSRSRRGVGYVLIFALLTPATTRAEDVCVAQEDLATLIADSRELETVEPLRAAQVAALEAEARSLREAVKASALATRGAVERAARAEMQADADRQTAEKARRRAKVWGGSGVAVGAVLAFLAMWGLR